MDGEGLPRPIRFENRLPQAGKTPLRLIVGGTRRAATGRRPVTAAASLVMWAEWMLFQMEWFDVWRYGIPGARYWVTTVLPWGLAFAGAGAVVGSALVRDPNGDPAVNGQRR